MVLCRDAQHLSRAIRSIHLLQTDLVSGSHKSYATTSGSGAWDLNALKLYSSCNSTACLLHESKTAIQEVGGIKDAISVLLEGTNIVRVDLQGS